MSYHIWSDKYGSDRSVVGASYQINGHPYEIIGVAPPGFYGAKLQGYGMPDFWIPVNTEPLLDGEAQRLKRPNTNWLDIVGRVFQKVRGMRAKYAAQLITPRWLRPGDR
jgi:hypothetical protein